MVKLSEILSWMEIDLIGDDSDVVDLSLDSRKVEQGYAFIALSGDSHHGIDFAYQAQRAGACVIFSEKKDNEKVKPKSRRQPLGIDVYEIENLSQRLGELSSKFYGNPAEKLKIVGITGTNGKTSSAWMLLQMWSQFGIKGGYIGTLGYGNLQQMHDQPNTTPSALDLHKILAGFVSEGITHVGLEVSSHGIHQGRVNTLDFDCVAFTNLSRDHLDFHKTIEEYASVKKQLFTNYNSHCKAVNADDYYGSRWLIDFKNDSASSKVFSFGLNNEEVDVVASKVNLTAKGMDFTIGFNGKKREIHTSLLGLFNVENILLVATVLLGQGFAFEEICNAIPQLQPVPGRMNCIISNTETQSNPLIIVDYAHTPDALEQVLKALKQHNARKIWCVFGCGGNRDKGKRPQMGHIAEQYADNVIITDDNPRFEDPEQIVQDILMGMETQPKVIHSRRDAIAHVITNADADDLILIAGKGHEAYQIVNGQRFVFDDRSVAKQILLEHQEKCA
ncbi:MAG TPA: UDP-N-acetylmuramoyl-L-alanyl-D-glutamate--2,6-diaminopimelate ligase [Gammaproteobacteria bacterium]|nr:UDP-N-acetylmuramoyl-L-alanyl-D-glutamate--2,6-diaminopimelate ligase [Xanthomonadales bacterium]MCB1594365.1 UDP-N-acetylmuramoyl-L-alanyl-D-glutamate--2,6-diaminopimelate ligase [Xanthomonadales bacterium]HOP22606.1 UDP-N-acetylmuramoyl-L-alanyl-D-glutamate--2,6-diaminopimelate ligase [Gammaproteobacteria bacterium]HPI95310.1 UDP-N-acetylmuramoyl-L-alanyl-D-glutamate--2,6-diaminopimelate ligase [Gammaproteobacteria bacterium]HPQ87284.1 UDP-N-acetylmuramoyl-L-alanyl-D-glutamate--2,6-diamino